MRIQPISLGPRNLLSSCSWQPVSPAAEDQIQFGEKGNRQQDKERQDLPIIGTHLTPSHHFFLWHTLLPCIPWKARTQPAPEESPKGIQTLAKVPGSSHRSNVPSKRQRFRMNRRKTRSPPPSPPLHTLPGSSDKPTAARLAVFYFKENELHYSLQR